MQSYLIVSKNEKKALEYARSLYEKQAVGAFDVRIVESEKAIGIEEVRNLQKFVMLKPLQGAVKAVIIKQAQTLTIEAQNALLKTLEEPPPSTLMMLLAESKETLLPTILSRCTINELKEEILELSEREKEEYTTILVYLQSNGVGYKLKLAQDFGKDREAALQFLEKLILVGREQMLKRPILRANVSESRSSKENVLDFARTIELFQKYYVDIKTTNINPRFALENLFLGLHIRSF